MIFFLYLADFTNLSQVRNAALELLLNFPGIEVLVNNAGVHVTTRQLTIDGYKTTFAVTHLCCRRGERVSNSLIWSVLHLRYFNPPAGISGGTCTTIKILSLRDF